jgi:rhodanese-related sulfurtransferase
MIFRLNILSIFAILFGLSSFGQNPDGFSDMAFNMADKSVPLIYNYQVKKLIAENKKVVFIDTRELDEYKVSHIKDAIFVGYDNFDKTKLANIDKNTIIVAYCSVGYRSGKIGKKLMSMGYKQVFNLFGGIFSWANNKHYIYSNNKITTKVHPYNNKWGKWLNSKYWK